MPLACRQITSTALPRIGVSSSLSATPSNFQTIRARARNATAQLEDRDLTVSRRLVCTAPLITLGALALCVSRPLPSEAVGIPEVLSQGLKKQLGQLTACRSLKIFIQQTVNLAAA